MPLELPSRASAGTALSALADSRAFVAASVSKPAQAQALLVGRRKPYSLNPNPKTLNPWQQEKAGESANLFSTKLTESEMYRLTSQGAPEIALVGFQPGIEAGAAVEMQAERMRDHGRRHVPPLCQRRHPCHCLERARVTLQQIQVRLHVSNCCAIHTYYYCYYHIQLF